MMEIQKNTTIASSLAANNLSVVQKKASTKETQTNKPAELANDFGVFQKRVLELAEDPSKVEEARKAYLNGELDSEAALLSAAENMLKFGL